MIIILHKSHCRAARECIKSPQLSKIWDHEFFGHSKNKQTNKQRKKPLQGKVQRGELNLSHFKLIEETFRKYT